MQQPAPRRPHHRNTGMDQAPKGLRIISTEQGAPLSRARQYGWRPESLPPSILSYSHISGFTA